MSNDQSFFTLGITSPTILQKLEKRGFNEPTPIQCKSIPIILAGKNCLGHAPTGTGKTAAFCLPLMQKVNTDSKVLVLSPTRELAIQTRNWINSIDSQFNTVTLCGGESYNKQIPYIKNAHFLVGTVGRVMDLIEQKYLDTASMTALVLDEADQMFEMGFVDDIKQIMSKTSPHCQTLLFSATINSSVKSIFKSHVSDYEFIDATPSLQSTSTQITQHYMIVKEHNRAEVIARLILFNNVKSSIVFVQTKGECMRVARSLKAYGVKAEFINGDLEQVQRNSVLNALAKENINCLVATDVVARGVDIRRITHIINWNIPKNFDSYIHRIGRTGRHDDKGTSVVFVQPHERYLLNKLMSHTKSDITPLSIPSYEEVTDFTINNIVNFRNEAPDNTDLTVSSITNKLLTKHDPKYVCEKFVQKIITDLGFSTKINDIEFALHSKQRSNKVTVKLSVGSDHGLRINTVINSIIRSFNCRRNNIGKINIRKYETTFQLDSSNSRKATYMLIKGQSHPLTYE